jgi:hypothetical protein
MKTSTVAESNFASCLCADQEKKQTDSKHCKKWKIQISVHYLLSKQEHLMIILDKFYFVLCQRFVVRCKKSSIFSSKDECFQG